MPPLSCRKTMARFQLNLAGVAVFVFVCLLDLSTPAECTSVHYCDKQADYAVKIKGVQINPNPVVRGKPAKFSIAAIAEDPVSGGKLVIDVKYFGVHVHQETRELCDETSCPVSAGDFVVSHEQDLPAYTPPGSYTLTMKMLGDGGQQLTCFSFDFKIKIGAWEAVADT